MMDSAKSEVLRYLGRRGQRVPPALDALIEDCMALMREAAAPRHVRMTFDVRFQGDGVLLERAGLTLRGEAISRRLNGCGRAVLLAATLGAEADSLIRRWERTDLTRSLVLDACATQLIEAYCDELEAQVRLEAAQAGLMAAPRFSPGYGDLPLEAQPELLAALDAERRVGLTCTPSLILLPRKSVTAIIGLGRDACEGRGGCAACTMSKTCTFRKGKAET